MDMPVGDYNLTKFHADNGTAECAASGRFVGGDVVVVFVFVFRLFLLLLTGCSCAL